MFALICVSPAFDGWPSPNSDLEPCKVGLGVCLRCFLKQMHATGGRVQVLSARHVKLDSGCVFMVVGLGVCLHGFVYTMHATGGRVQVLASTLAKLDSECGCMVLFEQMHATGGRVRVLASSFVKLESGYVCMVW